MTKAITDSAITTVKAKVALPDWSWSGGTGRGSQGRVGAWGEGEPVGLRLRQGALLGGSEEGLRSGASVVFEGEGDRGVGARTDVGVATGVGATAVGNRAAGVGVADAGVGVSTGGIAEGESPLTQGQ